MDDRRVGPRRPFSGWVEISTSGQRHRAAARDLSAGGLGVQMQGPLPPLECRVTSEFALPGISLPLALPAIVVWIRGHEGRLGLRFDEVDGGLAELLANHLSGRL